MDDAFDLRINDQVDFWEIEHLTPQQRLERFIDLMALASIRLAMDQTGAAVPFNQNDSAESA